MRCAVALRVVQLRGSTPACRPASDPRYAIPLEQRSSLAAGAVALGSAASSWRCIATAPGAPPTPVRRGAVRTKPPRWPPLRQFDRRRLAPRARGRTNRDRAARPARRRRPGAPHAGRCVAHDRDETPPASPALSDQPAVSAERSRPLNLAPTIARPCLADRARTPCATSVARPRSLQALSRHILARCAHCGIPRSLARHSRASARWPQVARCANASAPAAAP